jgi:hypothetical protein
MQTPCRVTSTSGCWPPGASTVSSNQLNISLKKMQILQQQVNICNAIYGQKYSHNKITENFLLHNYNGYYSLKVLAAFIYIQLPRTMEQIPF